MATNYHDITLALAGVCQAANLVQQFALTGEADQEAFKISIQSLVQTAPQDILDVYGGDLRNLKLGLTTLLEQLNGSAEDLTRYWLGLIALSAKLDNNSEAKAELARRIQHLPNQLAYQDLLDEQMLGTLASMYVDIISPLGSRIQVKGSPLYLQQPAMHNRIRACLLAGIRSAVLWRQTGGTKWQLLFFRRRIFDTAQHLYNSL